MGYIKVDFEELTYETIRPGIEVTGMQRPDHFDDLVIAAGLLMVEGFEAEHPEYAVREDVRSTLYWPHRSDMTVAERLIQESTATDPEYRAYFVSPTRPHNDFHLNGWHHNLLAAAVSVEQCDTLETRIFLEARDPVHLPVVARKELKSHIKTYMPEEFDEALQRKLKPRMISTAMHGKQVA